jgi:hypothetical protein
MPLFICYTCSGIENTALGFYYDKDNRFTRWKDPENNGKAFCSECTPAEMEDGRIYHNYTGKWHGEFPKEIATEAMVREWGLWPHPLTSPHNGFIYLGKFECLRPELEKQKRNAARRLKRKTAKGDP